MILPFPSDVADKIERFNRGEADVNDWRDLLSDHDVATILVALRNEAAGEKRISGAHAIISNNVERIQDIIWDIENKDDFDKKNPSVLGVLEVAKQIEISLVALRMDLIARSPQESGHD
jgi:hypothetical protein